MRITISEFRNGYKKVLEALHNGEVVEFPDGLQISKLVGSANSANNGNINSAKNLLTMSDEDIDRMAERLTDLIYVKLNTPKPGELNNSKESDYKERREEAILKTTELIPSRTLEARLHEVAMVMVKKHTIEPNCFIDEMNDWVPYPAHLVVKGVETRPCVAQEEAKLKTYDTGFVMNERAVSINDGSKPIPKPIKKKKKDL